MRSALYTGTVMHARRTPKENVFRYRVCFYLLDLDELPELDRRSRVRLEPPRPRRPPRPRPPGRARLPREHGIEADRILLADEPARARLRLQPGQLLLLLLGRRARLHRRRGQQHLRRAAALPALARERARRAALSYRHDKKLHVSPFFGLDQSYQWWFSEPGEHSTCGSSSARTGAAVLRTLTGAAQPADRRRASPARCSATR